MSLNFEFFNRPTNITAKVVCDSVSEQDIRLTTFEIEYPRIVMSEFNTHRAVSRNSSSSRAIPVSKMLEHTKNINLKPIYFGSKKSGMQAGEEVTGFKLETVKGVWEDALSHATHYSSVLDELGVAKEVTNRLVEPFQLVKVVCTATDWDNFFNLRLHPDSDPNICMLAYKMYMAMQESKPQLLKAGEYHLPYVEKYDIPVCYSDVGGYEYETGYHVFYYDKEADHTCEQVLSLEEAIKLSAASCASVSYRTEGMTLEKADKIFDMLIKAEVIHSSPFEHLATPISKEVYLEEDTGCSYDVDERRSVNAKSHTKTWEDGVTHINKQGQLCSGNLRGFIQYRHLLPNNTAWKFDFEKRMELFK